MKRNKNISMQHSNCFISFGFLQPFINGVPRRTFFLSLARELNTLYALDLNQTHLTKLIILHQVEISSRPETLLKTPPPSRIIKVLLWLGVAGSWTGEDEVAISTQGDLSRKIYLYIYKYIYRTLWFHCKRFTHQINVI